MNAGLEIRSIWNEISRIKRRLSSASGSIVTAHNSLAGLQGGAANQYYHLAEVDLTGLADDYMLQWDAASASWKVVAPGAGAGDVVGPAAATDNAVARFNTATGKLIQNSNLILDDTGLLLLAETANTKMTIGLTINQGANDDEIQAFKSSDVAHGITDQAETDTFGMMRKYSGAVGGLWIAGLSSQYHGIVLNGFYTSDYTDWNAHGAVTLAAYKKSGTNIGNAHASQIIVAIRTYMAGASTNVWGVNASGHVWQRGYLGVGVAPLANAGVTIEQGALALKEIATPGADVDYGKLYTKTDNALYFQDGAGTEHEIPNAAHAASHRTGGADDLLSAPGAIGGTTPAAGAFTTLSASGLISAIGGQIGFPAIQNPSAGANVLDDYEKGTWTPDVQFGGAKVGITYTSQVGLYTKVGRMVTITGHITLSSKGTSVGAAIIAALPFPSIAGVTGYSGVSIAQINAMSFADFVTPLLYSAVIAFYETSNAGAQTALNDTNFADNTTLTFFGVYFTT